VGVGDNHATEGEDVASSRQRASIERSLRLGSADAQAFVHEAHAAVFTVIVS
jgi:hypothetical protein